jgi:anaerobic magnesium-protoporphyrin IX monomethyl ester cyclase
MMDVLLVNPPRQTPQKADFPPLGLAYLSAVLKRQGHAVQVIDASPFSWGRLADLLREKAPSIVGVPCWTLERGQAFKVARMARQILPRVKVVLGGHHATAFPDQMFRCADADAVVLGEGEETILELTRALLEGTELSGIPGIVFRRDGQVIRTVERPFISDLDSIPYPDYSNFDLGQYLGLPEVRGRAASLITSRGCPHRCTFCSGSRFWRHTWRGRSAANVLGEIEWLYSQQDVRNVMFYDDNFTVKKERAIEICSGILDRGLQIRWATASHVTHINAELLDWMKRAGCYRIDFGVETGNPQMLRDIEKGQTVEQIERAFMLAHQARINPRAFLMVGNPGETMETIDQTVALMKRIRPYNSRTAGILWVLPDTPIYERAKSQGFLTDESWLQSDEMFHFVAENSMAQLEAMKDRLMLGMARNEGTLKAGVEYWARKAFYRWSVLQKFRKLKVLFQ